MWLALGAEAHLTAGLQLYHAGIEALVAFLDVGRQNVLVVLDGILCYAVGHCGNDAVSDELLHPAGIAEVLGTL